MRKTGPWFLHEACCFMLKAIPHGVRMRRNVLALRRATDILLSRQTTLQITKPYFWTVRIQCREAAPTIYGAACIIQLL